MRRHPGLHALSQHHHFALIQALEMRRAAEAPVARRAARLRQVAEKFLSFWKKTGQQHFREEEEILLPAYARGGQGAEEAVAKRLLAEHASIRAQIAQLEGCLGRKPPAEELAARVAELARTLHDHVRFEENDLFPQIEATLVEEDLQALGRQFTRLHPKNSCEI